MNNITKHIQEIIQKYSENACALSDQLMQDGILDIYIQEARSVINSSYDELSGISFDTDEGKEQITGLLSYLGCTIIEYSFTLKLIITSRNQKTVILSWDSNRVHFPVEGPLQIYDVSKGILFIIADYIMEIAERHSSSLQYNPMLNMFLRESIREIVLEKEKKES